MKEIIQKKLDRMSDLEQRHILKNIMWDVFKEIIDYQDEVNKQLEQRLFYDIKDTEENYIIYTTIIQKDRISFFKDFLYPLREEDEKEKQYNKKELIEKIQKKEPVTAATIFLKKSYPELEKIKIEQNYYNGTIITEDSEIPITVILKQNYDYINIERNLYNMFMENGVKWTTINNPYIRKFFDVVIIDCAEDISELNNFKEIVFDLGELERDKYLDYIPVWNIKKITAKGDGFPLPVNDKINYEHIISFEGLGKENGYLVAPDQNMVSMRKTEQSSIITSEESSSIEWNLYIVVQNYKSVENDEFDFPLFSNKKKERFLNRFVNKGNKVIRTYGELNRLAGSFEKLDDFRIQDIKIQEYLPDTLTTYDFNYYIDDEIRSDKFRKVMILEFERMEMDFLSYDLLSFLVSEIQQYFPEYICKGVIIE